MPSPMIRTGRQDIYNTLVARAGGEDDNGETAGSPGEFVFDYQYELFSLGLVVGFLHNHPDNLTITDDKGQDILRIGTLSESNEHRKTIEFIHQLAKMELSVEEPDDVDEVDEWLSSICTQRANTPSFRCWSARECPQLPWTGMFVTRPPDRSLETDTALLGRARTDRPAR